jgi:hypothetical protein
VLKVADTCRGACKTEERASAVHIECRVAILNLATVSIAYDLQGT